jgi:murein DD-endopeptidase MepM/ murein hydrolase activator NlpD
VRAEARLRLALVTVALFTGPARAAEVEAPGARETRDVSTLTAREAILVEQTTAARAAARWRLRALYRLVVEREALPGATRARAVDAGTRALGRELAEARSLGRERDQLRADRDALAVAARDDETIGAPPVLALPVEATVVGRAGVAPDPGTGLLVARTGLRLATAPGASVRAPGAGVVALVAAEPGGVAVMLDGGAGWTTIVGGLAEATVGPGERVAAGQRLGAAAPAPAAVTFEVWRGRHPVDPLLLVRTPRAPAALAAPPPLP